MNGIKVFKCIIYAKKISLPHSQNFRDVWQTILKLIIFNLFPTLDINFQKKKKKITRVEDKKLKKEKEEEKGKKKVSLIYKTGTWWKRKLTKSQTQFRH